MVSIPLQSWHTWGTPSFEILQKLRRMNSCVFECNAWTQRMGLLTIRWKHCCQGNKIRIVFSADMRGMPSLQQHSKFAGVFNVTYLDKFVQIWARAWRRIPYRSPGRRLWWWLWRRIWWRLWWWRSWVPGFASPRPLWRWRYFICRSVQTYKHVSLIKCVYIHNSLLSYTYIYTGVYRDV